MLESEEAFAVAGGCASETFAVAKASGIELGFADPVEYVRAFGSKIPNARPLDAARPDGPPVLRDRRHQRRCPSAARAVGLEAPVNETVTALVKAKEARIVGSARQV